MTTNRFDKDQTETFLTGIAQALGAKPEYTDGRVRGCALPGEAFLYLSYDSYKHRLHVTGRWPHSKLPSNSRNYGTTVTPRDIQYQKPQPAKPYVDITISADKAPKAVATDITRRFLPGYLATLAMCIERRDASDAYETNKVTVAAEVCKALGYVTSRNGDSKNLNFNLPANLSEAYGGVEVRGPDSVEIKVSNLGKERTMKLIAFLKTL